MKKISKMMAFGVFCVAMRLEAGDVVKQIVFEADPIAPASATYEQQTSKVTTNKYGAAVDFNMGANISTGPELWSGTFLLRGDDTGAAYRREDMWPGERHKVEAMRFRWTFGMWEQPQSMRGWYVKAAYNWTRINSRANRYTEDLSSSTAMAIATATDKPDDETDLITDMRHGASIAVGNRWLLTDRLMASVGASVTHNFKRVLTIDSHDKMAQADYESVINNALPDTRMATRPIPEVNLGLGYAW